MATKGQKFRKYTLAEKEEILQKHLEGYSARYLGELYGISKKRLKHGNKKFFIQKNILVKVKNAVGLKNLN